ncbi:MAG: PilZ domain-containing protein [Candidatus Omnitrophica bacterium]|nr:PilZ domain-containing protein [Candidatus Omnitrophota bacterium]
MKNGDNSSISLHRRFYERFEIDGAATVLISVPGAQGFILKDISQTGIGIIGNCQLAVNAELPVTLIASLFKNPVYRKARVVWSSKIDKDVFGSGLNFGMLNRIDFDNPDLA